MIVHILLVRARDDLSAAERATVEEKLASLGTVPEVQNMSWGPDFSGRSKGYTHGAVMHFADLAALNRYQQNEHHRSVVAYFDTVLADKLVVDYETESSGISV
jgi:hypothetical protein